MSEHAAVYLDHNATTPSPGRSRTPCGPISRSTSATRRAPHPRAARPAPLLAMGIGHDMALGALCLTLGRSTTESDIVRAAAAIVDAVRAGGAPVGRA